MLTEGCYTTTSLPTAREKQPTAHTSQSNAKGAALHPRAHRRGRQEEHNAQRRSCGKSPYQLFPHAPLSRCPEIHGNPSELGRSSPFQPGARGAFFLSNVSPKHITPSPRPAPLTAPRAPPSHVPRRRGSDASRGTEAVTGRKTAPHPRATGAREGSSPHSGTDKPSPAQRPGREEDSEPRRAALRPYLQALQAVLQGLHGAAQLVDDLRRVPRQVAHRVLALLLLPRPLTVGHLAAAQLAGELADGLPLAADGLLLLQDRLPQLQHRGLQLLLGGRRAALRGHRGQRAASTDGVQRQRGADEAAARRALSLPRRPSAARGHGEQQPGDHGQHPGGRAGRRRRDGDSGRSRRAAGSRPPVPSRSSRGSRAAAVPRLL